MELHSKNDANSEIEVPKKDTYLQKKGNNLSMNYDQYQKRMYISRNYWQIKVSTKTKIYFSWRKTTNYWWINVTITILMEYQKIANLLDSGAALNTSNQPSKFRTNIWVEMNDESRGT